MTDKTQAVHHALENERMRTLREAAIAAAHADGIVSTTYSSARAIWAMWWAERDRLAGANL